MATFVLSVDPANKADSTSKNAIHVYCLHRGFFDLIDAYAEACTLRVLEKKVRFYAQCYGASMIIIENTARGPTLIERLSAEFGDLIRPVTPRLSKAERLIKCSAIIKAQRVRVRSRHTEIDAAVDQLVSFPSDLGDDHVDALTNFLIEAKTFDNRTFVGKRSAAPFQAALVTASNFRAPASGITVAPGIAIARGRRW